MHAYMEKKLPWTKETRKKKKSRSHEKNEGRKEELS
jgi:hypothetical protein